MATKIVIDAGHGGSVDPGAVYKGREEKNDNLNLAMLSVRFYLKMELMLSTPEPMILIRPLLKKHRLQMNEWS